MNIITTFQNPTNTLLDTLKSKLCTSEMRGNTSTAIALSLLFEHAKISKPKTFLEQVQASNLSTAQKREITQAALKTFQALNRAKTQEKSKEPPQAKENTTTLLKLKSPYKHIELQEIHINKRAYHLYPTPNVQKIFKRFEQEQKPSETLDTYLKRTGSLEDISVENDTTSYIPKEWLRKHKKVTLSGHHLMRNKERLSKGSPFIFVINKKNELFATRKQDSAKNGRVHHSSLSRGKKVKLAGTLYVKNSGFVVTNQSGHYQPKHSDLDKFISWLKKQGATIKIRRDAQVKINNRNFREIAFCIRPNKQ